jgi:carbonic anhydrase
MPQEIDYLIAGYKKFRSEYFTSTNKVFADLVTHGQRPRFLVIACSDSRVDPALVLNCKPGDLFVIRNVANLVPPYEKDSGYHGTSASLEFGVCGLGIKNVILFGHTQCGGIMNLLENNKTESTTGFLDKWMELAEPARQQTVAAHADLSFEQQADMCSQRALRNSLENLQTFPWIKTKVAAGELHLHAWHFDLNSGVIYFFDDKKNSFVELDKACLV